MNTNILLQSIENMNLKNNQSNTKTKNNFKKSPIAQSKILSNKKQFPQPPKKGAGISYVRESS